MSLGTSANRAADRSMDLFTLGRMASRQGGGRGVFARSRQLLATGVWKGPRDAADSFVEEEDLATLGGLDAARQAGVKTLVAVSAAAAHEGAQAGLHVLWRLPYRSGEPATERDSRVQEAAALVGALKRAGTPLAGVIPTPLGEPGGLDTLTVMATCRRDLADVPHVIADFVRLGHRLAQMSLGFGADELFGPIMPERALRLGANANNPVMTRKEAAMLIRGAGLAPFERTSSGELEEVQG